MKNGQLQVMLRTSVQSNAILVVDDNESIHHDFDRILGRCSSAHTLASCEAAFFGQESDSAEDPVGFDVDHALQAETALTMVRDAVQAGQPYAVVFVDIAMSAQAVGPAVIEQFWQADPGLSIVLCTASLDWSRDEMVSWVRYPERLLVLKKPFDTVEVTQMALALSRQRERQQTTEQQEQQLRTELNSRTQQLVQAQQESERFVEAISSVVFGIDEDGCVSRWNATSESVFGVSARDVIGRPFREIPIDWEDSETAWQLLLKVQQKATRRNELVFSDRDGNRRVLGVSVFPVSIDGRHRGCLVLGADLTENRLLEQQLQAAHKLEAVGQLAAGVAHEINTPMQYIGDNLEYLTKAFDQLMSQLQWQISHGSASETDEVPDTPITQQRLESLQRNVPSALGDAVEGVSHVSRIVRAMKEFSHPGMETKMSVDVNQALQNTLTVTSNEWKHVASVITDFAVPARPIDAFAGELNQVFLNLIVNAVQAIEESPVRPGRIDVGTQYNDDCVEIWISDTGCGIPEEIRGRVFDPFFTTKEVGRGTGQGLALAHTVIVQKHGGRLWFDTDEQSGTTFRIQLPWLSSSCSAEAEQAELIGSA